jgi:hypothetical protein
MTSRTLDTDKKLREQTARTALAVAAGHDINDEEWERDGAMLLEFVAILRDWDRETKTSKSGANRGNEKDAMGNCVLGDQNATRLLEVVC